MIEIKQGQSDQMRGRSEERFVTRVAGRLAVRFPEQCNALGKEETRSNTEFLIERGRGHGLESEHDLFLFCCLGFSFGKEFDGDPRLPWAGGTLRSRILGTPSERLAITFDLAMAASEQSGRPWVPLPSAHRTPTPTQ